MDKTKLAYSSSFQGTFGNYKSLEYLDILMSENKVTDREKKVFNKIFTDTDFLCKENLKIPNHNFKNMVSVYLRNHLLERLGNMRISNPTVRSVAKNFIITRWRSINKK